VRPSSRLLSAPDQTASLDRPRTVLIIVVFGPGGVGKGTLIRRLMERDERFWLSQSWTTRSRRPGEPADAYNFVDRARFEEAIAEDRFLEWAQFLDDLYGTPMPEAPEGRDVILEIDLQGARQVLEACPGALAVMIVAPSTDAQVERLRKRGDDEAYVRRRVDLGFREQEEGAAVAHAVIVNRDVEQSVDDLLAIIEAARDDSSSRP
jgi:guanylate kinase